MSELLVRCLVDTLHQHTGTEGLNLGRVSADFGPASREESIGKKIIQTQKETGKMRLINRGVLGAVVATRHGRLRIRYEIWTQGQSISNPRGRDLPRVPGAWTTSRFRGREGDHGARAAHSNALSRTYCGLFCADILWLQRWRKVPKQLAAQKGPVTRTCTEMRVLTWCGFRYTAPDQGMILPAAGAPGCFCSCI